MYEDRLQTYMPSQQGMPSQMPMNPQLMPQYRSGGPVHPLQRMIENIRNKGEGEDEILAYINPEEAEELDMMSGHDVNPHTGLPQFGFTKKLKKLTKKIVNPVRDVLPIAAPIVGNLISPGLGGVIGGGLGGALAAKKGKDILKKGALGAGLGALQGYGLPALGNVLTSQGMPVMGTALNQLGASKFVPGLENLVASLGGGAAALGGVGALGGASQVAPGSNAQDWTNYIMKSASSPNAAKGALASLGKVGNSEMSQDGGASNLLNYLLLGLSAAGSLGRKTKYKVPKGLYPNEPSLPDLLEMIKPKPRPEDKARDISPYEPEEYELPDYVKNGYQYAAYKEGGFIDGNGGGQDDDLRKDLKEGSYIVDATTVSLLGDGNTKAGKSHLDRIFGQIKPAREHYAKGQIVKNIPALVSAGEYEISRAKVTALGKGNNAHGGKVIKKMIEKIRRHKGVKGLPPKSKPLEHYISHA